MNQSFPVNLRSHIPDLIIWGIFAAMTGTTIIHHVMWRDEWEAILISYKSNSLKDLWYQTNDEGHPILWFLLMYITKFLGPPVIIPKLLNYLCALGYCGIILFYAPFPRFIRYAIVFGYFFLFEYAVIARDYAISLLLIVTVMALWKNRQKHPLLFALMLFLLAQASFYTTMMTGVFVLILVIEPLLLKGKWRLNSKDLLPVVFGIAGVIAGYKTAARVPYQYLNLYFNRNHLLAAFDKIYCGYLPIPNFTYHSWNSILPANSLIQAFFSLVIIAVMLYFLRTDKRALLFWITYVIAQVAFSYFFLIGFMRHAGFLFIAALVAFWFIYLSDPHPVFKRVQKIIIGGVLAVHVLIAFYFVGVDRLEPFSASAATASWIHTNHLDHLPIYSDYICSTQAISGYLDKPVTDVITKKTYFAVRWGELDFSNYPDSVFKERLHQIVSAHDSSVLVLNDSSTYSIDNLTRGNPHIIPLKQFTSTNVADENFTVYLLKK